MLTVDYYEKKLLYRSIEKEEFFKIYNFLEEDPSAEKYFEWRFQKGRELQECLRSIYGDNVSVQDEDVEADNLCLEINEELFSDQTIKFALAFLRAEVPLFGVIIVLYRDIKSFNSGYLGEVIVNTHKIAVMSDVKEIFERKCKSSLQEKGGITTFDDKADA